MVLNQVSWNDGKIRWRKWRHNFCQTEEVKTKHLSKNPRSVLVWCNIVWQFSSSTQCSGSVSTGRHHRVIDIYLSDGVAGKNPYSNQLKQMWQVIPLHYSFSLTKCVRWDKCRAARTHQVIRFPTWWQRRVYLVFMKQWREWGVLSTWHKLRR